MPSDIDLLKISGHLLEGFAVKVGHGFPIKEVMEFRCPFGWTSGYLKLK